jgi:hypothetical protein
MVDAKTQTGFYHQQCRTLYMYTYDKELKFTAKSSALIAVTKRR